jgi:hypothetical protein
MKTVSEKLLLVASRLFPGKEVTPHKQGIDQSAAWILKKNNTNPPTPVLKCNKKVLATLSHYVA